MGKEKNSVKHRKRGPPATGKTPITGVRLSADVTDRIDAWAKPQGVTRSEAIRRLVEIGLEAKGRK
jgi:hypothetical protein